HVPRHIHHVRHDKAGTYRWVENGVVLPIQRGEPVLTAGQRYIKIAFVIQIQLTEHRVGTPTGILTIRIIQYGQVGIADKVWNNELLATNLAYGGSVTFHVTTHHRIEAEVF